MACGRVLSSFDTAYGFGYFVALLAESKPGIPDILLFSFSYATVLGEWVAQRGCHFFPIDLHTG